MNFFEHQAKARKRTFFLLILFSLAVLGTVLAMYVVIRGMWIVQEMRTDGYYVYSAEAPQNDFWNLKMLLIIGGAVTAVVAVGSLIKVSRISAGGSAIAEMLDATRIAENTANIEERKVLNVVHEMAIASGVPAPPVYILKGELGINAFAAGFSQKDAIIGISEGAVKLLTREEIQGVVAHEFSHIFNGDMRLNMHLLGILGGLMVLPMLGKSVFRIRLSSSGSRGGKSGGGIIFIYLVGLAAIVVGSIGLFFCKWIKAAISQQREFLADASAVQFTRNPAGIAGALKKIGGLTSRGSTIFRVEAEETSHFFFADALRWGESLFATHPPLAVRIKLLDPSFDGEFPKIMVPLAEGSQRIQPKPVMQNLESETKKWEKKLSAFHLPMTMVGLGAIEQAGSLNAEKVDRAVQLIGEIPKGLSAAASEPVDSQALVFGLLLDRYNAEIKKRQIDYLSKNLEGALFAALRKLQPHFLQLKPTAYLPLVELVMPTLKLQTKPQYESFRKHCDNIIHMDETVSAFEFVLKQVVLLNLDVTFGIVKRASANTPMKELLAECELLLAYLAQAGTLLRTKCEPAFLKAVQHLDTNLAWKFIPADEIHHTKVEEAMRRLEKLLPQDKEKFLKACEQCVTHDGKLDVAEMELLRAFSSALDCPIPPLSVVGR